MTFLYNDDAVVLTAGSGDEASARENAIACLSEEIAFANESNTHIGFVLIDLKNFHRINASLGYDAGDELLLNVVKVLEKGIKKASYVSRIANNTFCLVIPQLKSSALLQLASNRIRTELASVKDLQGNAAGLEAYIAASFYTKNNMLPPQMFMETERVLIAAKRNDCDEIQLVDLKKPLPSTIVISEHLEKAIDNNELSFVFQPKVNLKTMQADCAEVLMRWHSEALGFVDTERFFAVAEQAGMMRNLTQWAIKNGLREKSSMDESIGRVSVAINLSTTDLYDDELIYTLDNGIEIWGIEPTDITLEITEGVILQDQQRAFATLKKIRDKGVRISLDDFGTGYSSLAYFKSIPADELKIDKSFILDMQNNVDDEMIVELIIKLAKRFNFKVVAEGVESEVALNKLIDMGCDYAQGYYFSKPKVISEFMGWMLDFNKGQIAR